MKHILAECRGRRGGMAHQRPRSRIRNHYFFCCCIPIFILSLIVLPRVGAVATHKRSTEKEEDNSSSSSSSDGDDEEEDENEEYLYHIEAAKGIIHDYEPPKDNSTRPDFLYGTNQGPRVVEFYAPWCPHVRRKRSLT